MTQADTDIVPATASFVSDIAADALRSPLVTPRKGSRDALPEKTGRNAADGRLSVQPRL